MVVVDILEKELEALRVKSYKTEKLKEEALGTFLKTFFEHILEEDMELNYDGYSLNFLRAEEGYSYKRTAFNVTISDNYRDEKVVIKISSYSPNTESPRELKRLIMLGETAKVLLEKSEEIKDSYIKITKTFKETSETLQKDIWNIERIIKGIKEEEGRKINTI